MYEKISKTLFEYALHEFLSPKRVIKEYKLSKKKFDNVINDIVKGILESFKRVNQDIMIGNKKSYSIIEVAKLFKTNIKYIEAQKGERFESGKIINTLSFEPKINLKDYIDNFLSYK